MDGANVEKIIDMRMTFEDINYGLAYLATDGSKLYWADSSCGDIFSSNFDGSNPVMLVENCNTRGVASDGTNLFWIDGRTNELVRADLDGTNPSAVFNIENELGFGIYAYNDLQVFGDAVYFSESLRNGLYKVSPDGSSFTTVFANPPEGRVSGCTFFCPIRLEFPPGTPLYDLSVLDLGVISEDQDLGQIQIENTGSETWTDLSLSLVGADRYSFSLSPTVIPELGPGETTTVSLSVARLTDSFTGSVSVAVEMDGCDGKQLFSFDVNGQVLSYQTDTDQDGLSDAAEMFLACKGFDWQTAQTNQVEEFFENVVGQSSQSQLNDSGFYTMDQLQAVATPAPLLSVDQERNEVTITFDILRSNDLQTYYDYPALESQISVNQDGDIEVKLIETGDAAFYMLRAK